MNPYNNKFVIDKIKEYDKKISEEKVGQFEIKKINALDGIKEGYLYGKEEKIDAMISELVCGEKTWMSIDPKEIQGTYEVIKFARGKVGIVGLGLGYVVEEIAKNSKVSEVVVYEVSEEVVELYRKNFNENEKIKIICGDAFKAKGEQFDFFFVDIYKYQLTPKVVEDYILFNKIHDIKEYSFWGLEHFLLSCSYEELVWVYIPEVWMDMSKDISVKLDESGYIKYYERLDEELVSKVLADFKEVLNDDEFEE